jgi:hypothetical protein
MEHYVDKDLWGGEMNKGFTYGVESRIIKQWIGMLGIRSYR